MKAMTIVYLLLATVMGLCCVSKQNINVKVREADELPRGRKIQYQGGAGESSEDAVIIVGAEDLKEGVRAEYDFISELHGKKGKAWRVKSQSQVREGDSIYDIIEMELINSGKTHYIYFDITNCSWMPKRQ